MKKGPGLLNRRTRSGASDVRRLAGDTRGAIAVVFAAALALLMIGAGVAVDGMRFYLMRSELRILADSAAIAAGANPQNNTKEKLEAAADAYVTANANPATAGTIVVTSEYKKETQVFTLKLNSTLPTTFLRVARVNELKTSASAEVLRALPGPIEMALALDMTLSMYDSVAKDEASAEICPTVNPLTGTNEKLLNKLDVLRCAFTTLILDLSVFVADAEKEKDKNAMKIGSVPFAAYASVGSSYTSADWLSGETTAGTAPNTVPWSGCVGYRRESLWGSLSNPTLYKYPRVDQVSYPYCQGDVNKIVPLRSIYAVDDRKVLLESLSPNKFNSGSVLPSGLLWAWQLLNNESTVSPTSACDPDTNSSVPESCNPIFKGARSFKDMEDRKGRKVVVLFTDGWNSWGPEDLTAGVQMNNYPDRSDTAMVLLCQQIKNKKIELFVVSFLSVQNALEESKLRACASPGRFLKANSASELIQAFRNIAVAFRPVRLTK